MKTSELTGAALDWAVAKCEGLLKDSGGNLELFGAELKTHPSTLGTVFAPSTDWAQGGPIIEREGITLICWTNPGQWGARLWLELDGRESVVFSGTTPLIAAMRCYVASKLGDEVEAPNELH